MKKQLTFLVLLLLTSAPAFAQLVEPNQIGLRMGHVHLAVTDVDAQKQFWIGVMGGTLVKNGPLELIQFPGVLHHAAEGRRGARPPAGSDRQPLRLHREGHARGARQVEGGEHQDRADGESERGLL